MITMELPEKLTEEHTEWAISLLCDLEGTKASKIRLDFCKVNKINAFGYALLCIVAQKCREGICEIELSNLPKKSERHFLDKIFLKSGGQIPISNMKLMTQTLMVYGKENSIAPEFLDQMDDRFQGRVSEESLWNCRLILNELMQNTKDHSTSERYFVFAGLEKESVSVGLLDLGVTLPAKLESKYQCVDDGKFLLKSLELGVTTRRSRPGGLGLTHIQNIVKANRGQLTLLSRNFSVRIYFKNRKKAFMKLKYPLHGTWCMVRLPLEK